MNEDMKALLTLCDHLGLALERELEDGTWHEICEGCFAEDNPEFEYRIVVKP